MTAISRWWNHEARWWQFWYPQSGLPGAGIIAAIFFGIAILSASIR